MNITNYEFKARVKNLAAQEEKLMALRPEFIGEDNQTDTYFNVPSGRLKLREGNIENALIFYNREDAAGAKAIKTFLLYRHAPNNTLKGMLVKAHGIKVIVEKKAPHLFYRQCKISFR